MSKITFENKKGRTIIINRLSYPETVNERVYNAIVSGMFEGFLPVSIRQKRKETRIECYVQDLIPLGEYFDGVVTKKMFLDFVHEIALVIKNCEKNMINANNLDLKGDRIFIDAQTKGVKCIFWPLVNNQISNPPHSFLKQLPFELNFNPYEDNDYLDTYNEFFDGITPFSVNNFDKMVLKLSGKKSVGGRTTPSEALSGSAKNSDKYEKKEQNHRSKANIEYDPFADVNDHNNEEKGNKDTKYSKKDIKQNSNSVFCPSCGTENRFNFNFCVHCGTRLKGSEADNQSICKKDNAADLGTTVLGDNSYGTTVLGYDDPEEPLFPTLVRLRTEETYSIDKPIFRIGTEKAYCDLFICDNNYISRSHADIITRDNRFYIIDKNSTNKTFIDGKVISIETEIEIFDGTQIRLADEDFAFNIKQ